MDKKGLLKHLKEIKARPQVLVDIDYIIELFEDKPPTTKESNR